MLSDGYVGVSRKIHGETRSTAVCSVERHARTGDVAHVLAGCRWGVLVAGGRAGGGGGHDSK